MDMKMERIATKLGKKDILVFLKFFCPSEE
jgi:hypothetical protein